MKIQPIQNHLKLFYQTPSDNYFYHVTCKMILQDIQKSEFDSWDDDNYDYEFFFQSSSGSTTSHHVKCKLLSHILIVNILNKEFYGINFDANDLKRKYLLLTSHQKLNLELSLKKILPGYLLQQHEVRLNFNESLNTPRENIENNIMTTQAYSNQDTQNHLPTQVYELKLFYQIPNDNHFYHVTCKMILQDYLENSDSGSWDIGDDNHDYEFFFRDSVMIYHVTCKLLPPFLIINILNKEIYGMNFDVNDLKRKYLLTLRQKLNLEQNLKQILPALYFSRHPIYSMVDNNQDSFDNNQPQPYDDIFHQDENGTV